MPGFFVTIDPTLTPGADTAAETRRLWPGYFGDAPRLLPAPDAALDPFFAEIVPGEPGPPWPSRAKHLKTHFRKIEAEFRGRPRAAHLTACTIARLRRAPEDAEARALFLRLAVERAEDLSPLLNSRWLVSVCDTVVDVSPVEADRSLAFAGSLFVYALKIAETELRLYRPPAPWPPRKRLKHGGEIYDGVNTLWNEGPGDVEAMMTRIDRALEAQSPMRHHVLQIIDRAIEHSTTINRIFSLTGRARLPMAAPEKVREIARLLARI